jgi:flagellar FliL protein
MSKDKNEETDEAPAGGKKKLMLILAVVIVAAAGAAYFFLFSGGSAEAEEPVAGEVLSIEPVAVNLAGGGYLKIGLALQFVEGAGAGGHGGATLDGTKATDLVISTFSQAAPADVNGAREALKEALQAKIVEAYHGDVLEIRYTEYVTQ